jgi:ribosomal protein S17
MESREMRIMKVAREWMMMAALVVGLTSVPALAQETAAAAPAAHQAGTVKSTSATGLTLTTTAGQDVTVAVPDAAKVLVVAPGSKDLKSATSGTLSDVTPGDKVLVTMTPGGDAAARVILMKAQAIAATHANEEEAWTKGGGGIVKSVDPTAGAIVIASGLKTVTVTVTPQTIVRRYSGESVRFADAKVSNIGEIQKGDQLRVRGTRSADGSAIAADELVTGSFRNFSGLIASVDASAGTVTLKDLVTKKAVTVAVGSSSDVRRIPAMLAQRVASRMAAGTAGAGGKGAAANTPAAPAEDGAQRERSAGMDLSQMLSRLPTETLAGLKAGDAVMIVATSPASDTETPMAVTLLAGVDAILSASPKGQTMTLSPWSLGGGEGGGEGGGGPEGGAQHAATPQ